MAIQAVKTNSMIPLIDNSKELTKINEIISSYMGKVGKGIEGLENAACIKKGFPFDLVELFRKYELSLWKVPVVNLGSLVDENLLRKDMRGSLIARFEQGGKPGIVVILADSHLRLTDLDNEEERDLNILCVRKRLLYAFPGEIHQVEQEHS